MAGGGMAKMMAAGGKIKMMRSRREVLLNAALSWEWVPFDPRKCQKQKLVKGRTETSSLNTKRVERSSLV
jgi:hypothetical protein